MCVGWAMPRVFGVGLTFEGDGTLASLPPRFFPFAAAPASVTGDSLLEELPVALLTLLTHLRREGMVVIWW